MDLTAFHREQHLARAAELAEAGEDKSDHFLEASIGIETKPRFTVPDVAERYPSGIDRRPPIFRRPGG